MLFRLIILNGASKGQRHSVGLGPLTIGSGPECQIRLDGDEDVARRHAVVESAEGGLLIRDLGTVNRMLVNKRETGEALLAHGDVVVIGRTEVLAQACLEADIQGAPPARRRRRVLAFGLVLLLAASAGWVLSRGGRPLPPAAPDESPAVEGDPAGELAEGPPEFPDPDDPAPAAEEIRQMRQALADLRRRVDDLMDDRTRPPPVEAPAPAEPPRNAARRELDLARAALEAGRWEETHARLTVLLADDPGLLPAYELRARAYEQQGEIDKAIGQWTEILSRAGAEAAGTRAEHERARLTLDARRTASPRPRSARIRSHTLHKFPESAEYDEMRLLNLEIERIGRDPLAQPALQILFFDRNRADGRIRLTGAIGSQDRMPLDWDGTADAVHSVSAAYVAARNLRPLSDSGEAEESFFGYVVRLYVGGRVEDEIARPSSLLTSDRGAGRRSP